jgi:hypothetical protein
LLHPKILPQVQQSPPASHQHRLATIREAGEGNQTEEGGLLHMVAEERKRLAAVLTEVLVELGYFRDALSQVCYSCFACIVSF